MASVWDWLPGQNGMWNYLSQYPERYRDQIRQGLLEFSKNPSALSAGPLITSFNPLGPSADDVTQQVAPLVEPLAQQQNRMYEALTGEEGQLRGEHLAGPLIGSVFRGRLPDVGKTGFFSPTSRALAKAQDKATGKQYAAAVKKEPGATAEAKQGGLIELLEQAPGTMTKEQALSMWNPVELTETVKGGDRHPYIDAINVGGVEIYRGGQPVDYDPYSLSRRAGRDIETAEDHAKAVLIEDVLIDEWKLHDAWAKDGESGVVDAIREKTDERIASWEDQLQDYPDDDQLKEQILELRIMRDRMSDQWWVNMSSASPNPTRFGDDENLNLPGGTNEKEILVQLPLQPMSLEEFSAEYDEPADRIQGFYQEYLEKFDPSINPAQISGQTYEGGHYAEPNVLAHIRTNERDVGGRKALHIEEIQSDWHQQGQKKGYWSDPVDEEKLKAWYAQTVGGQTTPWEELTDWDRENKTQEYINHYRVHDRVPDAPFKKNWHELAFKRALTEAINDPSIERLPWTTGAVQADRYNLAKYIDSVEARLQGRMYLDDQGATVLDPSDTSERKYELAVREKNGSVRNINSVKEDELADYLGKDLAEKIVNEASTEVKTYSGLDLEVGGEFHKNLYDKKITQFAKKFLKKYGVEPQKWQAPSASETPTATAKDGTVYYIGGRADGDDIWHILKEMPDDSEGKWVDDVLMETPGNMDAAREALRKYGDLDDSPYDVWYIDITPEMREEIMTQGVPLTQRRKQMGLMAGYA